MILSDHLKSDKETKTGLNFDDEAIRKKFLDEFKEKIHKCRHLMTLNDILKLSQEIAEFSDKNEFRILAAWSEKLRQATVNADIKQAEKLIDQLLSSISSVSQ